MVELVRAGRGVSDPAREFGCNASSFLAWIKAAGDPSRRDDRVDLTKS